MIAATRPSSTHDSALRPWSVITTPNANPLPPHPRFPFDVKIRTMLDIFLFEAAQ
jgi:hypothetical protein